MEDDVELIMLSALQKLQHAYLINGRTFAKIFSPNKTKNPSRPLRAPIEAIVVVDQRASNDDSPRYRA